LVGFISFEIGFSLGFAEVLNGMWIRIRRDWDGPRYWFKTLQKLIRVKRYLQKIKNEHVSLYSASISAVKLFATFLTLGVIFDPFSAHKNYRLRVYEDSS